MFKGSRFLVLLFSFLFLQENLNSQSFIGTQSNFSGSSAMSMNPSLLTTSNLYFDLNVIGVGILAYNDCAYIKSSDMMKMFYSLGSYKPSYNIDGKNTDCLIYSDHCMRYLYESLDVNVLNFMYDIDGKQAIGLSFNGRVYTSASKIPWEIPEIVAAGKDADNLRQHYLSDNVKVATMEWAEVALAYSNTIYEHYRHKIDVGASIKYLLGYSAAVANINQLDYTIFSEDSIIVNNFDANLAYSLPINYNEPLVSNNAFDKSLLRGQGVGLDLGFTYTHKRSSKIQLKRKGAYTSPKVDYIWRTGVSLMDVGFINFNNNAVDNYYSTSTPTTFDVAYMDHMECFDELSASLSAICYDGDSLKSKVGDRVRMGLPTTLRLQFDYNIYKNYYLNATVIQPVRLFEYSVMAAPRLMLEPRYESEYFDFGLPISLYNYEYLRLGASLRIAFITIGTEKLATYLGIGDANGMDFYVSVKVGLAKSRKMGRNRDACWSAASFR